VNDTEFKNFDGRWTSQPSVTAKALPVYVHQMRLVNTLYDHGLLTYDAYLIAMKLALATAPDEVRA
jgi:hypothetical protein